MNPESSDCAAASQPVLYNRRDMPGPLRQRPRWRTALVGTLTLLPVVALIAIIRRYHVDVFYWDQWELVPIVDKLLQGTLSFSDLWAQHNEHRPLFPRLAMAYLARATNWNTQVEVAVNVVMVGALLPVLWWATRQWRSQQDAPLPDWTWPTLSLLLFSPAQWENWLWGWQLLAFLQVMTSVLGLALLARRTLGWGSWALAALVGIVGSYSFGAGLLYWPIGLVALLARRQRTRHWQAVAWVMLAALVVSAYALDFHGNPYMPTPLSNFVRVRAFGKYAFFVATFLGSPVAPHDWRVALLAGSVACSLFAWLTWRALAQGRFATTGLLPFTLGASAIATALMIGLGRAGFGFAQALESRYITASQWLWVSVLLSLAHASTQDASADARTPWPSLRLALAPALVVVCLVTISWPHGRAQCDAWQQRLSPARDALIAGTDLQMLQRLYPMPEAVVERRAVLQRWRLSVFREGARGPASTGSGDEAPHGSPGPDRR